MALSIDIRVNDRVVASAAVQNIAGPADGPCDYVGRHHTRAYGDRSTQAGPIAINQHDRTQSVWALVAKIASAIVDKEAGHG